jgi:polyisoprenoid-binding protein YceI
MQSLPRAACLTLAALALTGCPSTILRPPPPQESLPEVGALDLKGATLYKLDPTTSNVAIQVFRGGTLARLGHNHVITAKELSGRAWVHPSAERSGFEVSFPVARLVVDDPKARAAAGTEFPGEIPEDDREGTRKNMLRAEVLDAETFPTISLRSVKVSGTLPKLQLVARITIKDVSRDVTAPANVAMAGNKLTATGAFDIQQTSFGIKPFSIGLGALEVQDKLHIEFELVGERS